MHDGPAPEALRLVARLAREARTERELSAIAVTLFEPLVDLHWQEILDQLEDALERSAALRRVMRGSILSVPSTVLEQLKSRAIE